MYRTGRRKQRTVLTVFVAVRKKSIISPEFSIVNMENLIIIFVKVGYFKSGVRVGINHQETLVSLWEAHPPTRHFCGDQIAVAASSTNMSLCN